MTTAASVPSIILEGLPDDNDSVPVVASRRGITSTASVATTQLASDVGSVMGRPKIAQLKSVTWYKNDDTTAPLIQFTLQDVKVRRQMKIALGSVRASSPRAGGSFDDDDDEVLSSMIVPGHIVKSIHNRPVKGLSAQAATEVWKNPPKEDHGENLRFGSITVMDPEGDEVWVKATIYKPRPDMTLEDLGMTVWYWGYLCIKSIEKDSIFKHTALKSRDHIVSVNDIVCDNVKDEAFAHLVKELPNEITITVQRRKQRFSGMFN